MYLVYRYAICVRKEQHAALARMLEMQRVAYNRALVEKLPWSAARSSHLDSRGRGEEDVAVAAFVPPATMIRWISRRVGERMSNYWARRKAGGKVGVPRTRGPGRFRTFGFVRRDRSE